jgi:hypothetical protein
LRIKTSGTFCSKMCVEALQQAAIVDESVNPRLVTPSGLHAMLSASSTDRDQQSGVIPALDFAV